MPPIKQQRMLEQKDRPTDERCSECGRQRAVYGNRVRLQMDVSYTRSEPCSLTLLLVVRKHSLRPHNALTEAGLKRGVTFAFLDVVCNC